MSNSTIRLPDNRLLESVLDEIHKTLPGRLPREELLSKSTASARALPQTPEELAQKIDHTFLRPEATFDTIHRVCEEARTHGFASVCVNPTHLALVADQLRGCSTKPITVVGFPLGASTTKTKVFETREAVEKGAEEIDMVLNLSALLSHDFDRVAEDISEIVNAAAPHPVKVILETGFLDLKMKVAACILSRMAGAAFTKTSTGFGPGGATEEDVMLMRALAGPKMQVKASGGIRTFENAQAMLRAGADRLGASAGVAMVQNFKREAS